MTISPGAEALLAKVLRDSPKLDDAACRDHPPQLFDGEDVLDVEDAREICLTACRSYDACRAWYESLPPKERPCGVCAGELREWPEPASRVRSRRQQQGELLTGAGMVRDG